MFFSFFFFIISKPIKVFETFNPVLELKKETVNNEGVRGIDDRDRPIIYRFSDCLIEPKQTMTLDLARDFLCLDIYCNDKYACIDPYLELMSKLVADIIQTDPFVQLRRIGIRKINGVDGIDPKEANGIIEYFSQRLSWGDRDEMIQRQYTDNMLCPDIPAFVIYSRIVRRVPGSKDLRFTLDMDCYKDESFIEKRPEKDWISSVLVSMNEKLFDLFKMGIKLEYLNQNL